MRIKSFAILAMTGLLTASIAYVAPAMAEDISGELPMEQTLADNSSTESAMQAPAGDSGMSNNQASSAPAQGDNSNNNNANTNSGAATTGSDGGTPDAPSGDDDY